MAPKVAILIGSLRKESFSRKIAARVAAMGGGANFHIVEIGDLPLYNEDLEQDVPASYTRFREELRESDAVLFITPEYNRSIPAPMKNAIDVGSRPMKASVWNGKPVAIISISRGALGGFGANHHLRQSLVGVSAVTLPVPEVYLGGVASLLNGEGAFANPATESLVMGLLTKFLAWIEMIHNAG